MNAGQFRPMLRIGGGVDMLRIKGLGMSVIHYQSTFDKWAGHIQTNCVFEILFMRVKL